MLLAVIPPWSDGSYWFLVCQKTGAIRRVMYLYGNDRLLAGPRD